MRTGSSTSLPLLLLCALAAALALFAVASALRAFPARAQESPTELPDDGAPADEGKPAQGKPSKGQGKPALLDFEADVIEGKRKAPDMFLQTESQKLTPDAMIFLRNNFNDFHQMDRTRRPRLSQ